MNKIIVGVGIGLAVVIAVVVMLIATSKSPQDQLIEDLRNEGIVVEHQQEFINLIDSICPSINTSYLGLEALKTFMTEDQAFDTLAVVRYSGYCN